MNLRLAAVTIAVACAVPALAASPAALPIQGYLTDDAGVPIDGATDLRFRIYTSVTTGTAVVDESVTLDVENGQFSAYIDVPHATYAANDDLYLGLAIGTGAELVPRLRLATVPYAGRSVVSDDADLLEGFSASDFRQVTDTIDYADITGAPAAYTAGQGITITGSSIAANQGTMEGWARGVTYDTPTELTTALGTTYIPNQACASGFVLVSAGASTWTCSDPSVAINALDARLTTAEATIGTLGARVSTAETTLGTLGTRMTAVEAQLARHGGTSAIDNAPSCLAIKQEHPNSPDGTYYLNVLKPSDPALSFRAYCLMSRGGGGWTKIAQFDNATDLSPAAGVNPTGTWISGTTGAGKLSNAAISMLWSRTRFMIRSTNPSDSLFLGNGAGYMIFAGHFPDFGVGHRPGVVPYSLYCEQTGDDVIDKQQNYSSDGRADCAYGSFWLYDHNYTGDPQCYGFTNTTFRSNLHFCGTPTTNSAGGVTGITQIYVRD